MIDQDFDHHKNKPAVYYREPMTDQYVANDNESDEEFYDAVSSSKSNDIGSTKSLSSFKMQDGVDLDNSRDEMNIIAMRKIQLDKFKQREETWNSINKKNNNNIQEDSTDSKSNVVNFSIHTASSSEKLNELQSKTEPNVQNELLMEAICNQKCRDDLYEMRSMYNPEPEPSSKATPDFEIYPEHGEHDYSKNVLNDSILRKYLQSNNIPVTKSKKDAKYFTYSPDTFQSMSLKKPLKKQNRITTDNEILNTDKFGTWPSNMHKKDHKALKSTENENNFNEEVSSFEETSSPSTSDNIKNTNENSHSLSFTEHLTEQNQSTTNGGGGSKDKVDSSFVFGSNSHMVLPTPEEFINPVDKQIAAIFQMSCNSSMLEASNSDMDNQSFCNSSIEVSALKNELNYSTASDNENASQDQYGESDDNTRSSKRMSSGSYSSKPSEHRSGIVRRESFRDKTKESLKNAFNKFGKAVRSVHSRAEEALHHDKDIMSESDSEEVFTSEATKTIKYKTARSNKGSHNFNKVQIVQILHSYQTQNNQALQSPTSPSSIATGSTSSAQTNISQSTNSNCIIWAMKFSACGKLLASVGKDQLIRVWVLRVYYESFKDAIKKHCSNPSNEEEANPTSGSSLSGDEQMPFYSKPFVVFSGHTSDILDVSWSKNLFLLSASSDKTCRLWHIYKPECLCTFHHSSIISAISFHPKDDRYFISACLDGKLRLWSIAEKKVALWNELNSSNQTKNNFITAVCFCQGGKTIAVGTFHGKCILYHTEHLKYYSLINVRSTKGRNSRGSKITGIEVLNNDENKIIITSNDSRIRLYDLRDLSLVCKYKGFSNSTVHIKASLSPDDQYIISGSKDKCTYIWKTNHNFSMLNSGRRDRNMHWERIQAHNAIVTCALFAPKPMLILNSISNSTKKSGEKLTRKNSKDKKNPNEFQVFVSAAGCDGVIKIFANKLNF